MDCDGDDDDDGGGDDDDEDVYLDVINYHGFGTLLFICCQLMAPRPKE